MIDEQAPSEGKSDSEGESLNIPNIGQVNEEWQRALSDPLPAWKQAEIEAWMRRVEEEQEVERELRDAARRGAL